MEHTHTDGSDRRFPHPDDQADRRHRGHHHTHHHHDHARRTAGSGEAIAGDGRRSGGQRSDAVAGPALHAVEDLQRALRRRLRHGAVDATTLAAVATVLGTLTQALEARR